MTATLLLAPHADDESLFAAYLAQRHEAHIAVVFDEGRENELWRAARSLGCGYTQLRAVKGMGHENVETFLQGLAQGWDDNVERIIAPAIEDYGHLEHNMVGELAEIVWPDREVIRYRTYAPRGTRSHGNPVEPDHPDFIMRKLEAMACYRSQILEEATRPWFYQLLDMREWTG